MSKDIKGVTTINENGCVVFYIDEFTEELKTIIREKFSAICYGGAAAATGKALYSYKVTLKEFIRRYEEKTEEQQKGMIGELLFHILLNEFMEEYQVDSPYFNLEERNVKKGFDLVLNRTGENGKPEIWITEVKSGNLRKDKDSSRSAVTLINTAKNDLKKRLVDQESTVLWMNAVNGAKAALDENKKERNAIISILEDYGGMVIDGSLNTHDVNVVLVGTVFNTLEDQIKSASILAKKRRVDRENLFNDAFLVAIQKATFDAVYDFIESECVK